MEPFLSNFDNIRLACSTIFNRYLLSINQCLKFKLVSSFCNYNDISYSEKWQPPTQSLDGYEHIVNVEYCPPVLSESPDFPPEAAKAKEAAQREASPQNTAEYHEIMEGTISLLTETSYFTELIK